MNRKLGFYIFFILLLPLFVVACDQLSKMAVSLFVGPQTLGPIILSDTKNFGFMLGSFSELSSVLRVLCASTLLGFFVIAHSLASFELFYAQDVLYSAEGRMPRGGSSDLLAAWVNQASVVPRKLSQKLFRSTSAAPLRALARHDLW